MNDIALCDNQTCPLRNNCKRSKKSESLHQWYAHFEWEKEITEWGISESCKDQRKII